MARIVCDTNILVSGFLFNGNEKKPISFAADKKVELYSSNELIEEFERVLLYPKLAPRCASHSEIKETFLKICKTVTPKIKVEIVKKRP